MAVTMQEVRATGLDAVTLATSLLQRARLADPVAGLWEAADVQWWWRKPQRSDEIEQLFWLDDDGPVAGVLLTSSADDSWQCDPVIVPGGSGREPDVVWDRALEHAAAHAPAGFDVPVSDDGVFDEFARRSGLTPGYRDSTQLPGEQPRQPVGRPARREALMTAARLVEDNPEIVVASEATSWQPPAGHRSDSDSRQERLPAEATEQSCAT